jgi:two-component system, NarL family, response regulator LiaR
MMNSIRIVLIEDHDLTRIGMRAALKQMDDMEIVGEARDAKSGLNLLKSTAADVAIVDVGLPDMSGIELTQQFKRFQNTNEAPQTKILIMTMYDSEDTVLAAFAAGADSYYMKVATVEKIAEAVRVTHEGNSWLDPAIARIVLQQSQKAYATTHPTPGTETVMIQGLSAEDSQMLESYPLTIREFDVLNLIVDGCSNNEISDKLYITVGTVKTHVRNILNKLCVSDRTQIAVRALRAGLIK